MGNIFGPNRPRPFDSPRFRMEQSAGVVGVAHLAEGEVAIGNPDAFSGGAGVIGIGAVGIDSTWGFIGGKDLTFQQDAGVYGESPQQGVIGLTSSAQGTGVYGSSVAMPPGVAFAGYGVRGETTDGVGVYGRAFGRGLAGSFVGNIEVSGNVSATGTVTAHDVVLSGLDCAENFPAAQSGVLPGTVMVIGDGGRLTCSTAAYDTRVAGIVSGGGAYQIGVLLGGRTGATDEVPLALVGRVYCLVDATPSAIRVGDLLTTSDRPGHAMKAADRERARGAILGKSLAEMETGCGLVPVLVTMQ